jgi:hypothetical protein
MATKIPILSIPRPSKIYPIRDFWFENIPSGNTDYGYQKVVTKKTDGPIDEEIAGGGAERQDDAVEAELGELRHELQGLEERALKKSS